MNTDTIVDEYLHALLVAATKLPGAAAAELVSDVREHVREAIAAAEVADEAAVRTILDRLGTPESIVEACLTPDSHGFTPVPRPSTPAASMGLTEMAAVLLMSIGSVMVPVFGPLAGIYFARASTKWSLRTKRRATWIGALSAAWFPLFTVVFLFGAFQRPMVERVWNLLPGVQYESSTTEPFESMAVCNTLQTRNGPSASTPDVHQALSVVSEAMVATVRPADEIPTEWLGAMLGDLVAGVARDETWRVLERPSDGRYVGVVHITPSADGPGWVTATVVGDCGSLSGVSLLGTGAP